MSTLEIVGIAGRPIDHSLTPTLQQAAFREMGLAWRSQRFDVGTGGGASLVETMRHEGIRGLSVTMPLKAEVAKAVDLVVGDAQVLDSVNCLSLEDGQVVGLSTDGEGFVASPHRSLRLDLAGADVALLGAGGAARAVAAAVAGAGAASLRVLARDQVAAARCAAVAGQVGEVTDLEGVLGAAVVVNATPIGMSGTPAELARPLVDPGLLGPHQVAVDLIYHPLTTPWLDQAAATGAQTLGGLGMLVHQAAAQIERWTGAEAPVEAMWDAAMAEIESR